jgi:hypothetical protein
MGAAPHPTAWLVILGALLWAGPAAAQQAKDVRRFERTMQLERSEDAVRVGLHFPEVFSDRFRHRLGSGFTSRLVVAVQLVGRTSRAPLAQALMQVTVRYDIWEERYAVRLATHAGRRDLQVKSLEELVTVCARLEGFELVRLPGADLGQRSRLEVRIEVNPTSPELRRKVREYLANPDGGRSLGGPRSFFGSFSKIFVNEQDFKADAVYLYRSQDFNVPP